VAAIHPIEIKGEWLEGFALDYHTISSTCIGHDEYGHPIFDTKYTELGGLLYRLKSKRDKSVVSEIVETIGEFLQNIWNPLLSIIVPMAPSTGRTEQPVFILADALGERLKLPVAREAQADPTAKKRLRL